MADEIILKIDLDDKEFIDKILSSKKQIKDLLDQTEKKTKDAADSAGKLGDAFKEGFDRTKLGAFTSELTSLLPIIGGVVAAGAAIKAALNLVETAEEIKAVNTQFELLTKNFGLATDKIREGLEKSSNGLIDNEELLQAANRAIVQLGSSANKLPETMELARKITASFGGELTQNFETLNRAIASGQARQLRSVGIIIDQDRAYRDYAKSIGTTAGALSEAGRQQALLNAVLEKGNTTFKGIDPNLKEATNLLTQIKLTVKDLMEAFALAFDKVMGPSIKGWLLLVDKAAKSTRDWFIRDFGEGAESASLKLKHVEEQMNDLATTIISNQKKIQNAGHEEGFLASIFGGVDKEKIQSIVDEQKKAFEDLRNQRNALMSSMPKEEGGSPSPTGGISQVDLDKQLELQARFEQQLSQLKQARLSSDQALMSTEEQLQSVHSEKLMQADQMFTTEQMKIANDKDITDQQRMLLLEQVEMNHASKIMEIEKGLNDDRIKMLDNYVRNSQTASDAVVRSFQASGVKAKAALKETGEAGAKAYSILENTGVAAFESLGSAIATGQMEIGKIVLGGIGDMASMYGKYIFLAAAAGTEPFFVPNPSGMAAGAALMVFGGLLKGLAGGGGGSSAGGSAGGGNASQTKSTQDFNSQIEDRPHTEEQQPKRSVTIQIQGHYLETDQTKRMLMDLVRGETDATDFKYVQIGGR